ncbi:MAG: hypothetical protein ACOX0A_02220 [Thermoguttaceae bacterium]|jgi:uncharacterized repeat protein (TIGR01451 family)
MIRYTFNKQRRAQLAIVLSLLLTAPIGVKDCWGQAAGFAQSRGDIPATAESGPRRGLLSQINPFNRSAEQNAQVVDSTTISQPFAMNMPLGLFSQRTQQTPMPVQRPAATDAPPTTPPAPQPSSLAGVSSARESTATAGSMRSVLAGSGLGSSSTGVANAKLSGTGGVASLLLDELEENADTPIETNADAISQPSKKPVRRSLRSDSFPSSLELLDDDIESDDEPERRGLSSKGRLDGVLTTDDELSGMLDEDVDESEFLDEEAEFDEDFDEDESPVAVAIAVDEPVVKKRVKGPSLPEVDKKTPQATTDPVMEDELLEASPVGKPSDNLEEISNSIDERLEDVFAPPVKQSTTDGALSQGRTPNIEVKTLGPRKLTVGQSSTYTIRVRNVGTEVARKLVVTTKLPDNVVDLHAKPSVGNASIQNAVSASSSNRCVWNVGTLSAGDEQTLTLDITPTKRASFELVSSFDFEHASAFAKVEVQEPILEALIEGRDSIEWGVEDRYRLRLRNVGNGDAEDVVLNVSTGENDASQRIGLLRAGEEKTVEMSVKTISEDFFTIDVHVVGAFGLEARAAKKVATLRGKPSVTVSTPDLQFVDGEFEAIVHVRNNGNATLKDVDVVVQFPSGVEALRSSNQARRNDNKRRIYWVAPFIRPDEEITFSVLCRVNAAGNAKFEAVAVDKSGLVAQARSVVNVESIALLAMRVNAPKDPVAVGATCVYELVVENNGTCDAYDINTGVFLGSGMKPLMVEDNRGYVYEEDSKALFKKIDCLRAGESIAFRVRAEALAPGNQKVQAMLQSTTEDVSLLSEETTYCYSRRSTGAPGVESTGKTMTATRPESSSMLK